MIPFARDLIWEPGEGSAVDRRLTRRAIYVLLVLGILILGLNWPIMAVGLRTLTPLWMGAFRVLGAAVMVIGIGLATGSMRIPPPRDLPVIVSLAVFRLAAVFFLVFTALQLVPAGRSAVVVWTISLWTVPLAVIFLGERMSRQRWLGLGIGISGVIVLFEPWGMSFDRPGVALGHGLLILAAITDAATAVHIRAHRWTITPIEALPWQLAGAAVVLTSLALLIDGLPFIEWTAQLVGVVAYQSVLASGVSFVALVVVLRNLAAVSTNLTLMAVPVVGVVSSAIFLGEQVTVGLAVGLGLVLAGVAINLVSDRGGANRRPELAEVI
jgi:drug/metabolite transporter (DMT)-like permease